MSVEPQDPFTAAQRDAYDTFEADLAALAEGTSTADVYECPGGWAFRLPVEHAWARLALLRLAAYPAPEDAVAFAADCFGAEPALLLLVLDGLARQEHALETFSRAGWRVDAPGPSLRLEAQAVPMWDDSMIVEPVRTARDRRTASEIVAAAYGTEVVDAETLRALLRPAAAQSEHTVYGARVDDVIVSTVRAVRRGERCGLYLLATRPDEQGKGYGTALLENACVLERDRGAKVFFVPHAGPATSVFAAAGFEPVGRVALATRATARPR